MQKKNEILLAVVIYKTSINKSLTLQTIKSASSNNIKRNIFIYDNGSIDQAPLSILFFKDIDIKVFYIHNPRNPGVSKAYNEAAECANKLGISHLALLDQDTELTIQYFDEIEHILKDDKQSYLWVPQLICNKKLISPTYFFLGRFWEYKKSPYGVQKLRFTTVLNSGIILNVLKLQEVGGYDETFPLDLSDHVFLHRYKKKNSLFGVMASKLNHQLSVITDSDPNVIYKRYLLQRKASKEFAIKTGNFLHYFWCIILGIRYSIRFKKLCFIFPKKLL